MRQISSFRFVMLSLLLWGCSAGYLLSQSIDQQVLGTTGREVQQGPVQLSFTVGELATASFSQDTLYLTQGYQQVVPEGSTAIDGRPSTIDFLVYPNPFSDVVTIRWISDVPDKPVELDWIDAAGRTVLTQVLDWIEGSEQQLNVQNLPPGFYQVRMVTKDAVPVASFPLIRITH